MLPLTQVSLLACLLAAGAASAQDLANGKDVYGTCAACHGANGEGGKQGEYPRLAGQPPAFLIAQLQSFQKRTRNNLPMFPYTEPRELSEADMKDVAAYLAAIDLPTHAPQFKESATALERLVAMEKVLVVPRVEGDLESGKKLMRQRCGGCHGTTGRGKPPRPFPRLAGQYPNYLLRQVEAYRRGDRVHEEDDKAEGVLMKLTPADIQNVLAYLTSVQDAPDVPADAGRRALLLQSHGRETQRAPSTASSR